MHLVLGQTSDGGIRNICWLLELTQLDRFIAASYGAQQKFATQVERLIVRFGQEEELRLAPLMPPGEITLCQDETFHPQICLVAIEPVSNFLILEQYAPQRDASTWNAALTPALQPFTSLQIIQCVSDQATALITYTESILGVHHSPDLFHVQQELSRATSGALHRQTEKAEKKLAGAEASYQAKALSLEALPRTVGDLALEQQLRSELPSLEKAKTEAFLDCQATQQRQRQAREARCGISQAYHPFDLHDGTLQEPTQVEATLNQHFATLEQVATEAQLSTSSHDRIAKALRVLPSMIATLVFFWKVIARRAEKLAYSTEIVDIWKKELLSGYYLESVAKRCREAKERRRLRALSESILHRARDGPFGSLAEKDQRYLEEQARLAADVFQRSSSCVEGRNGQLSLRQHGLRNLRTTKLLALRVLHNYVIRRADRTTAAERFFGQAPRSLFRWLRERLPYPSRPRTRKGQ